MNDPCMVSRSQRTRHLRCDLNSFPKLDRRPVHLVAKRFTIDDQVKATEGVECRKDANVIDEIPMAYKDIDAVMEAQRDLVEVVHTLKQVVCVKG